MLVGDGLDGGVGEEGLDLADARVVELDEALGSEGAVSGDGDAVVLEEGKKLGLDQVRVVLDLVDGGLDLGAAPQVGEQLGAEVGDSDGAEDAVGVGVGLDEALEGGPRLGNGGVLERGAAALFTVGPEAGVGHLGVRDVLEGDGEVDQEQVEVANAPCVDLVLGHLDGVLVPVKGLGLVASPGSILSVCSSVHGAQLTCGNCSTASR